MLQHGLESSRPVLWKEGSGMICRSVQTLLIVERCEPRCIQTKETPELCVAGSMRQCGGNIKLDI